ncbi:hypothetical protein BKA62DRAFT_621348 [Auriculariales sp. MPI-PUGE-AT-0066]|nr:hypothetical protein BKA62DRAFT_621348 [Auriculariales sp. MPI-PUGE-AT-0066]
MSGSSETARFDTSVPHSHDRLDRKDQRTHANTVAEAAQKQGDANPKTVTDPLEPARSQGHEPSRGAQIDKQLQDEEEEELRNKGKI